MTHRTHFLVTAALIALAAVASADTVHLTNGSSVEGKATRDGDKVIVETRHGKVTLNSAEVRSIVPGKTRFEVYEERAAEVPADDADAQVKLGDWCKEQGLKSESRRHWKKALEADADHAGARKRLGFIRYQESWLTRDQYYEARGFVKRDGKWVHRDEARKLDAQKRNRDADRERAAAHKAHVAKIKDCVKLMSSMKRKTRLKGKVELQKYAETRGDLKLASWAGQVASYYNRQWHRIRRSLVKTEVRATHTQLKRPIPTFTTSLGAFTTPVRIQLPELSVVKVRTTVLVPADIELDEDG